MLCSLYMIGNIPQRIESVPDQSCYVGIGQEPSPPLKGVMGAGDACLPPPGARRASRPQESLPSRRASLAMGVG